jgi:hypothetical protein
MNTHQLLSFALAGLVLTSAAAQAQTMNQCPQGPPPVPLTGQDVVWVRVACLAADGSVHVKFEPENRTSSQAEPQRTLTLRFQLIEAYMAQSRQGVDPAIAAIDSVLRDLFRFNGYRLLSQGAVSMEIGGLSTGRGGTSENSSSLMLSGPDGKTLSLWLGVSVVSGAGRASMRLSVELTDLVVNAATGGLRRATLLTTTIGLTGGKTVVIGSTQPSGPNTALILAVRPESRYD